MANGRPLFVWAARKGSIAISIFSTNAPGATLVETLSLAKPLVPKSQHGVLGVRFISKVHNPNLGVHLFVTVGGGPSDHTGTASPEAVLTNEGLNTSPRLEVDISSLYASGRTVEYVKLWAYAATGGGGGLPSLDLQTLMLSGDPAPSRAPLIVVPSTAPNEVGVDVDCVTDVSPQFSLAYGIRNLANALLRRLITPRGSLFYDPDYGLDLREYLNAALTDGEVGALAAAVGLELEKDERVASAQVAMTYIRSAGSLRLRCQVTVVDVGDMSMLLSISQTSAAVLDLSLAA